MPRHLYIRTVLAGASVNRWGNDMAMKRKVKEKAVVLAMSFVLFMGGVFALSMDRGNGRTIVLVFVVLALLAIAARQTIRSLKKKKE